MDRSLSGSSLPLPPPTSKPAIRASPIIAGGCANLVLSPMSIQSALRGCTFFGNATDGAFAPSTDPLAVHIALRARSDLKARHEPRRSILPVMPQALDAQPSACVPCGQAPRDRHLAFSVWRHLCADRLRALAQSISHGPDGAGSGEGAPTWLSAAPPPSNAKMTPAMAIATWV